jgi:diacylglycerol kinase family enzyme
MATRVTLLHNPDAGAGQHSGEELLKALGRKGFETTYMDTKGEDCTECLKDPGELVVVAGGDGTVGKVARHLINRGIPIGLLPLGTANNIACSLGIAGAATDIIASWDLSRRKAFDVGVAKGPGGAAFFLESAGFGIFPRLIRQHEEEKKESGSREEELKRALKDEQQILNSTRPHSCTIHAGGWRFSGHYLLVEIMNIRLAGPNMNLAPEADPGDGLLDVVLVREDEREKLRSYLADCLRGKGSPSQWEVRRAKELQVEWGSGHYHTDDEVLEGDAPVRVGISVLPKALEFLVPPP